jgi:hypothetical protein
MGASLAIKIWGANADELAILMTTELHVCHGSYCFARRVTISLVIATIVSLGSLIRLVAELIEVGVLMI